MLKEVINGVEVVVSAEREAQIRAEWAVNDAKKAEYDAKEAYKDKRKAEYPTAQDLFNALWGAMDSGEISKAKTFYNLIKVVNDKYPKPQGS